MGENWREIAELGFRYKFESNFEMAITSFEKAISLAADAHPLELATLHNHLAVVYRLNGEFQRAERCVRHAIRTEMEFGNCCAETTTLADYLFHLGTILKNQERFKEALESVDKGLELIRDLLGEEDSYFRAIVEQRERLKNEVWKDGG